MFSFLLKLKRRIKRLLKVQAETRQRPQASLQSKTFKFLVLVFFSLLVGGFYPGESVYDPLNMPRRGEIALEDIRAPFRITVLKTDRELKDEMEEAKNQTLFVIDNDTTISHNVLSRLHQFVQLIDSVKKTAAPDSLTGLFDSTAVKTISQRFPLLSTSAISQALSFPNIDKMGVQLQTIFADEIYQIGVLPDHYSLPESRNKNVIIRIGNTPQVYYRDRLYTLTDANTRLLTELNHLRSSDPSVDEELYYSVGKTFIQPNLRVNMGEYNKRVEEALSSISKVKQVIEPDEYIVRRGQKVTEDQERILREMVRIDRSQGDEDVLLGMIPVLARMLLAFAAFSTLYLFLYFFRKDIYKSNPKLLALMLVFALQLFITYLEGERFDLSIYLFAVALLPILVTILFDAEVGILSTVVLAFILGTMHRFDYTLSFMTIVVGTVACFTSRHVRKRSEFFRIMYSTSLTFAAFIFLVESLKLTVNPDILTDVGYGLVNGIVTVLLTIGILPFFESLFGITTDITLLELSDLNHPLLKRLALEAPGTFHHSIVVGNLSEAAAKAIGGNSLLARVGAYFHDIGKIEIPEYFIENQLSVKSRHEELTPSMSSIILSSHVKMGRKLGEDADIPDEVLNFIEEHHGTMVQTYFYNKALEQGLDEEAAKKFRYPGPKPQIRETGIAMLADAVEAASRTLDDPKPARLNNLIQRIINDRFQSGELDECPLTLRDLAKIKEAFTQMLIGTFHQRIVYPKKDKTDEE
jgi:hypothetical protein